MVALISTTSKLITSLMVATVLTVQLSLTPLRPCVDTPPPPEQPETLKPDPVSGATISTASAVIAVTSIGPRPYLSGTATTSPTATLIWHVPLAHGPVGEGDGVAATVGVGMPPDADDAMPGPSDESAEHDVRTANTTAMAAADGILRSTAAMGPRLPGKAECAVVRRTRAALEALGDGQRRIDWTVSVDGWL
jgi:hypothetical protein